MKNTKIEWCDHTFNPWWGCTKVSPGCEHCYAERIANRWHPGLWGVDGQRRTFGARYWAEPLAWNRIAEREGVQARVFCGSMCDVFEANPKLYGERYRLWELIERTPWLIWMLLTKRPENIEVMLPARWGRGQAGIPANVWLGCTVENQTMLDIRRKELGRVAIMYNPSVVFLSCEPLLGPIDLSLCRSWIDWLIIGGETGPGCRALDLAWVGGLMRLCDMTVIPVFLKQRGGMQRGNGQAGETQWPPEWGIVQRFPPQQLVNTVEIKISKFTNSLRQPSTGGGVGEKGEGRGD